MCVVVIREEKGKTKKLEFLDLFFLSKNGRFVTQNCFPQNGLLKPAIFIVFFGCAFFWPSCQKREILDTHQKKKRKKMTDN